MTDRNMREHVIAPPATIGMLGGGQLGRYALVAARRMGYRTVVVDPDPAAPAGPIADHHLVTDYDDPVALEFLAETCAVVTTEFENPPASALEQLAATCRVAPPPSSFAITQDRIAEKTFLESAGATVAPWLAIPDPDALPPTIDHLLPGIVKTARLGYDGRGQIAVTTSREMVDALSALRGVPCVLERRLNLERELSVVLTRDISGAIAAYPPSENIHRDGILDTTIVPARIDPALARRAITLACAVAERLDHVGVLGVEMFVVDGDVIVNELAPRPHNSAHWTLDAARTDQFTQHIRSVVGAPPGPTDRTSEAAVMVNLLGDLWRDAEPDWATVLDEPNASLHLYGKHDARPGRKMGHITVVGTDVEATLALARSLRDRCATRT